MEKRSLIWSMRKMGKSFGGFRSRICMRMNGGQDHAAHPLLMVTAFTLSHAKGNFAASTSRMGRSFGGQVLKRISESLFWEARPTKALPAGEVTMAPA